MDWYCRLRTAAALPASKTAYVGIRAHHIDFIESASSILADNVFPCWLIRSSETPFRITLFLSLREPSNTGSAEIHLQAEVLKEKWERFRERPQPWHVRLSPSSVFVMPE
jgi:molybdate transport system permease protein